MISQANLSSATRGDDIRQFIVELLLEKGPTPEGAAFDDYRYLDVGHINSLAFIKFVLRLEERFGIRFSDVDIGGEEIRTVGGLVPLISAKLAG